MTTRVDVCLHLELDVTSEGNVVCDSCGSPFCAFVSCTQMGEYISRDKLVYCVYHAPSELSEGTNENGKEDEQER